MNNDQNNYKDLHESIKVLFKLQKSCQASIILPDYSGNNILSTLSKNDQKGFQINITEGEGYRFDTGNIEYVRVNTEEFSFSTENFFVNRIDLEGVYAVLSDFHTIGFNKEQESYFRLVIPVKKRLQFYNYLDSLPYKTDNLLSSGLVRVDFSELSIDFYPYTDEETKEHFLIFDCSTSILLKTFEDCCFSILIGLGYLTGKFIQDEGYYFTYDNKEMRHPNNIYYTEFRNSSYSIYTPIYRNAFGYIRDHDLAKEVSLTLREVTLVEFSKLCQWIYDSEKFRAILLVIIESMTSSLLLKPAGLSVALEALTELIVDKNIEKAAPIKDLEIALKIKNSMKEVILSYDKENFNSHGMETLMKKIDNLNQLTNSEKLSKPFDFLRFKLSKEDKKAIEHRNDFLHGAFTLNTHPNVIEGMGEVHYISLRLYTLLAVLIFKSIGYDSKIVNHPKIHEKGYKKNLDEPYFRQI